MNLQALALFMLVAVSIGGVAWVFIYPLLSGERQAEKRKESVARPEPMSRVAAARSGGRKTRREQVEGSLKDLEERNQKRKRPSLSTRIMRAGLSWSKQRFFLTSGGLGVFVFVLAVGGGAGLLPALGFGFFAGCGLPLWMLSFLKKRRESRFITAFPDAVDVIVRGIKSGLPVLECFRMIANESPEPVRSEFRSIIETQAVGLTLGEASAKLYEHIPLAEANFFGIVITIQQKAGGNLSEALGNLSRVLRDRKRMRAKIKAMSMEAKASASIIAALPVAVMTLVYLTSPDYIALLWTQSIGRVMLAACGIWMMLGVLVMRKMINFDF
ncbi:MAG: type II secretion system F family protein [Xanthobacteraceae bacterium]